MTNYMENLTKNLDAMYAGKIGSAILKQNEHVTLFLSAITVGKSTFIYGDYTYDGKIPSEKLELLAIITENLKVVFNRYMLFKTFDEIPEDYICVNDYIAKLNNNEVSEKYTELYNTLPTEKISPEYEKEYAQEARYNLLVSGKSKNFEMPKLINKDNVKSILAGYTTPEEITLDYVSNKKEQIIAEKSRREYIKKLMTKKSVAEPWELELSENLRKLDAKSVTAEFYFNGKSASGKIDSEDILRTLANKSDISSWNFSNGAEGKKVLAHLGADWKNRLTCDHIQKITYRGKTVFERK